VAHNGRQNADDLLATALASGTSLRDVAGLAGVGERTATRRWADPDFRSRVSALRAWTVESVLGTMTEGMTEAAATLRRALTLKTAELGRRHPDLAVTHYNLGSCLDLLGRRRSARRQWRRAVALLDGAVAADHPTLVAARRRLGR